MQEPLLRGCTEWAVIDGLVTCVSVWACPWCAGRIYAQRADEVSLFARKAQQEGLTVQMLTLTIAHYRLDDLDRLLSGISEAWSAFRSGRAGQRLWQALGVDHDVRSLEMTHSFLFAWHPHFHFLLATKVPLTEADRILIYGRWADCVAGVLGEGARPTLERGAVLSTPGTPVEYIEKLGLEIASILGKETLLDGYRTPWQIAQAAVAGDRASIKLWKEYTKATFRRKQLTWSKGTKTHFGIEEVNDKDAVQHDEDQTGDQTVRTWKISAWLWDRLCHTRWPVELLWRVRFAPDTVAEILALEEARAPPWEQLA
jgi:hypothetical protein